jgi:DNA-binding MarR family transcriptional regulator
MGSSDLAEAYLTASRALVGIAVRSIEASPVEITVVQHRLLVALAAQGDRTISQIAEALGVNQSNASRHCDRLQRLDLVSRRRAPYDGRVVCVSLTGKGRDVVRRVTRRRLREIDQVLGRMGEPPAAAALQALEAFAAAAEELADRDWHW